MNQYMILEIPVADLINTGRRFGQYRWAITLYINFGMKKFNLKKKILIVLYFVMYIHRCHVEPYWSTYTKQRPNQLFTLIIFCKAVKR